MKPTANTELEFTGGSGSRPTAAGREPGPPPVGTISQPPLGNTYFVWVLAAASIVVILGLYFFVFRAAHEVQIREVPLATKGGRP